MAQKRELNDMNAIGCLLVILIHVLSLGITKADPSSWQAAAIYFPWRLAAFVVPMFLYTGAVKLAFRFMDERITAAAYIHYILQRVRKIYVPYVIWVAVYFGCFLQINYVRGDWKEFLTYLAIGNIASPFYYIVIVMQFYLLMPLWVWMLRHIPAYLAVAVSLLITLCMQQFSHVLSLFGLSFPYSDRVFLTYLIFWTIGLYAGKHYEKAVSAFGGKSEQILCCGVVLLCSAVAYLQYSRGIDLFNLYEVKLVSDLLSIAFLHSFCLRLTKSASGVQQFLQKLYESSFFVYLSHCLFLTLVTDYLQRDGVSRISLLLLARFFTCYTIPFILYGIYRRTFSRFKYTKGLLG